MKGIFNIKIFKTVVVLSLFAVMAFALMAEGAEDNLGAEQGISASSIIVKFISGITDVQRAEVIARNGGIEVSRILALRLHIIEVPSGEILDALSRYQSDPYVESAELNIIRKVEAVPSDYYYATEQWALTKIGWESVFGAFSTSGSAKVAILDTGVHASHPDLAGKLDSGISIIDNSDPNTDHHGHGTWLAGIVAAATDNGEGIAGVAFSGVNIIPVKVFGSDGTGLDSDIIKGVIWAADNGADVILMGFSNTGFSQHLQDAIDYAWGKGAVLVASTGNEGLNVPTYPAGHRGVIGVSATDKEDGLASFSNYGDSVFLAAPGVEIAATDLQSEYNDYLVISGTSASAAIVAGAAAFIKAVEPEVTNGIIVGRLARTADPAGTRSQTGNGRINMLRALQDTSIEEIQPAGAPPVGDGGPYLGPYKISGQSSVSGYVYSSEGGIISGATISCTSGCNESTTTNASGYYSFSPLNYQGNSKTITLTAAKTGYESKSETFNASNGSNHTINFTLTPVCTAPTITTHPQSQTKTAFESVTFSMTATGTEPFSYQWRKNGTDISGATGSSYTISSLVTADAGNYDVVLTNSCGSVTSNAATLTVNKAAATVTLSNLTQTYTGSPLTPTATTTPSGLAIVWTGAPQINAGSYSVTATVDDPNYEGSASDTFEILKADTTTTVTCPASVTYNGTAQEPCTAAVTGPGGLNEPLTVNYTNNTNAGTATASATYAGGANYNGSSDSTTFTINKADATCTVSGWTGIYDGNPHGATGTCTGVVGETLSGLNLGATFTNVPGGTAYWTFTDETGNYNDQSGSVAIVINARPITVTAEDKSKVFGSADPELTFIVGGSGLAAGDTITTVFSGALTRDSGEDVGTYAITQGTLTANPNYTITSFIPGTLTITPYIAETAVTVTPNSQQYSDKVTFEATLSPASINGQAPATSVTFLVGTQNMGSCTLAVDNGSLSCKVENVLLLEPVPFGTPPTGQMSPGNKTITAQFSGINPNFSVNDATTTLTITKEDAMANYTGAAFSSTACTTCSTATVTLAATIQDITAVDPSGDPDAGDIRKATVTFVNRDAGNAVLCTAPVGLVSASDTKTGTATCNWTANIGTSSSVTYTVGIIVNGYYTRNDMDDNTVVTVSKPQSNFIAGGGYIINQNSAGLYPGEPGRKTNFGFNVKYNKSGTNLQGSINVIIRNNGRVYQIKGNVMTSLAVNLNKAIFNGRANIQDITDPLNIIPIDGNATLQVTMTDNGEPGSRDTIGITVWNKAGGLWFSSNWQAVSPPKTVEQNLGASPGGGNLVVR